MPGQLIIDNVIMAHETLHVMHGRKKGGALALKLDISKAYDKVMVFFEGNGDQVGFSTRVN